MTGKILTLIFVICNLSAFGQNCNCKTELEFVVKYYENNLPGFIDNVNSSNVSKYKQLKNRLFKEAHYIDKKINCFKLLTHYVEYFRDNHSSIQMDNVSLNEKDTASLNHFLNSELYKSTETWKLQKKDLVQFPVAAIKGIYQTADSTYTIAIIADKTNLRDYIGVVINSRTTLWKPGQVKMELKSKSKNSYEAFVYLKNHSIDYYSNFELRNGILGDSWFKTSLPGRISYNINNGSKVEFREINDSTNYLRIPSFSNNQYALLDSVYKRADRDILSKPNLIIDVRNNGGGSDRNVYPLLKYLYTRPFREDNVDLYVTKDNIKMWESWYLDNSKDTLNYNKKYQEDFLNEINKMKKAPLNSFLPRTDSTEQVIFDTVLRYPNKIAIITNKRCASSCETLLFWAKESDKTIIVGENSGGYVGYGEVVSIPTPCYKFRLNCTMTRYRKHRKYEVSGIEPNIKLDNSSDWIEQTLRILREK